MNNFFDNSKTVILKSKHTSQIANFESLEGLKIQRISTSLSPLSFIHLMHYADNQVNPRKATYNSTVKAIEETLANNPELFFFKTKGLLLSTLHFDLLERNRMRLSFGDSVVEGIMDGGHNAFALADFIAMQLLENRKNFKSWDEIKYFYQNEETYKQLLDAYEKNIVKFPFTIPVEIIAPSENDENSILFYCNNIADICSARNANVQLKEATQSNKEGLYEYLKECLDPSYANDVIWRSGEKGYIKAEDVVALACLPIIKLYECNYLPETIGKLNKIALYSSKSKCVSYFRELMKNSNISKLERGQYILQNKAIMSGFKMVNDIILFADRLYYFFPLIYNHNDGSFGRITGVKQSATNIYKGIFRTFNQNSPYDYAIGFFYPIICGLTSLMKYENGTLSWIINPSEIDLTDKTIENIFNMYMNFVRVQQFNPQKIGKEIMSYELSEILIKNIIDITKKGIK